jgi:hypothetical protein
MLNVLLLKVYGSANRCKLGFKKGSDEWDLTLKLELKFYFDKSEVKRTIFNNYSHQGINT